MNFFLIFNEDKDINLSVTKKISDFLCNNGAEIYISNTFNEKNKESLNLKETDSLINDKVPFVSEKECVLSSDIAIVIGGDGTILKAAKLLYAADIPIIGINLGKVGYMSELEINESSLLSNLFEKANNKSECIHIDERMMLSCNVVREGRIVFSEVCLNEVVVLKGDISRMIDLELSRDGEILTGYQCDGIIISTPTGSTAYSMSAGGAIIDPKIECISVVPLCPYLCINSSPIIFSKDSKIEISYRSVRRNTAYISVDGEEGIPLLDGDKIIVSSAEYRTKLLRFKKFDFYKLLNIKLTNRISELADRK